MNLLQLGSLSDNEKRLIWWSYLWTHKVRMTDVEYHKFRERDNHRRSPPWPHLLFYDIDVIIKGLRIMMSKGVLLPEERALMVRLLEVRDGKKDKST